MNDIEQKETRPEFIDELYKNSEPLTVQRYTGNKDCVTYITTEKAIKICEKYISHPVDQQVINFLPDAVKSVTKAIREDKELYIAYQANIAMAFQDEYYRFFNEGSFSDQEREEIHTISNNAAKHFLDLWCKE